MKIRSNPFLRTATLATIALSLGQVTQADIFDINGTTAGFGVANGGSYDWWTASSWSDGILPANDAGTAATVNWQGTTAISEQAFFEGSGTAGENYTVRLGSSGATNTYVQNIAINVNAVGNAALAGAAGNVTIGNSGDTGNLIIRASNSVGAQNSGLLTINNGVNLQSFTLNYRGGSTTINGVVSGTGKIVFGSGAFGLSAGTLTLANTANTYSGRANTDYIASGYTLAVTKLANGGSNSSIGTSSANIGINGGTLKYIGDTGAQSTNLGLHVASGGAILDASGATAADTISISGAPTYSAANAARTITLTGANIGDNTMGFTFNDNGTGVNSLTKTGVGRWVVNQANGYTGGTNANGGTLVATNVGAFGVSGRTINFNTGAVEFATDTTANAYVLNVGSGNTGTVIVNRATSGSTITHTMGVATLGNGTLNIQKGANVTGDGILEFSGITMSAGVPGLSTGTMLNPTSAKVLVSGNITRTGGSANLLTLDGTHTGNLISGIITGPQALTKSNTSTWELSNANTFSGKTLVTGGTLKLTNNLALQNSAFDTSGGGTLDTSTINTPTFGGLTSSTNYAISSNVTGLTLNPASAVTNTFTGNLSGGATGMTLTKTGAGTQILGGSNNYTGLTTVNGGELRITNAAAIGGTNVTVSSGRLALDGGITVTGKSLTTSGNGTNFFGGLQSVSGTNTWAGNVLLGANDSRVGARLGAVLVISGAVDDGSNTYNFVVRNENQANTSGAGNATTITELSGVSTYGGNTQIIAGLTRLAGGNNRLPTTTILQFGGAGANAKFDLNGVNQEVAGLAVLNNANDTQRDWNANELTNSSTTLSTLTVNTTTAQTFGITPTAFTGNGNYVGIITGNIALTKSGTETLTLSGSNTYTGATTITDGTLALTGSGSIAESAIINVNSGSKFNVTGVTSSATIGASTAQTLQGLGTVEIGAKILNIGANGTLAPGASPSTLTFDVATGGALNFASGSDIAFELGAAGSGTSDIITFSSAGDWLQGTANATLALSLLSGFDYTSTYTIFENVTTTGFTFAGVTGYDTVGYTHTFAQSGNNYQLSFAPVPESSTAILGILGSLTLLRRRRI